jgi:putative ABC transport system substrate-binding protein
MSLLDNHCQVHFKLRSWTASLVLAFIAIGLAFGTHLAPAADVGDMPRIGYITMHPAPVHMLFAAEFRNGLRAGGYLEGQNVTIEWRFAEYDSAALARFISELIRVRVNVLVADGTQAALAAKHATRTIPIVALSGDILGTGLVDDLARPGGNVTGLTLMSEGFTGKRLSLLKEIAPRTRKVAVLFNPENAISRFQLKEAETSAPGLGLQIHPVSVRRGDDLERVFPSLPKHADAVLVTDDLLLEELRTRIGELAIPGHLPSICGYRVPKDDTCLIWYGPDILAMVRREASYVIRILDGTKPGDIPVEQPTKFRLIINARTANALGIVIPQSLAISADDVIR